MRAMALISVLAAAGCLGGGAKQTRAVDDDTVENFKCNGRRAEYVLVGGFVAPEMGIKVQCSDDQATLIKWTADDNGQRDEQSFDITRGDFQEVWRAFEDAGWRNLSDCLNSAAGDTDQVYTFEIADEDSRVSLTCQGKEQPFPYDRLVNALDIAAGAVE